MASILDKINLRQLRNTKKDCEIIENLVNRPNQDIRTSLLGLSCCFSAASCALSHSFGPGLYAFCLGPMITYFSTQKEKITPNMQNPIVKYITPGCFIMVI